MKANWVLMLAPGGVLSSLAPVAAAGTFTRESGRIAESTTSSWVTPASCGLTISDRPKTWSRGFDTDRTFLLGEIAGRHLYFQTISRTGETVDSGVLAAGASAGMTKCAAAAR
jgi:hypothetical protein